MIFFRILSVCWLLNISPSSQFIVLLHIVFWVLYCYIILFSSSSNHLTPRCVSLLHENVKNFLDFWWLQGIWKYSVGIKLSLFIFLVQVVLILSEKMHFKRNFQIFHFNSIFHKTETFYFRNNLLILL